jgi:hypothetical protein
MKYKISKDKGTSITIEDLFEVIIFLGIGGTFGTMGFLMSNIINEYSNWNLLWYIPFGLLAYYIAKGVKK